jgi:hypothetical protein
MNTNDNQIQSLYIQGQIDRLKKEVSRGCALQIRSADGKVTNWLSITEDQLAEIRDVLINFPGE